MKGGRIETWRPIRKVIAIFKWKVKKGWIRKVVLEMEEAGETLF